MTFSRNAAGLAGVGAALAAAVALAAACGSEGATSIPDDDGGHADAGFPTGDATPGDEPHDPLAGVDAGCPIKTDGPRSGATASSVPRAGATGIAWSAPENARNLDGQFARATLGLGQTSEHLRVTDFGFKLPAGAQILGVEVEFKRQAGDTGIVDGNIELWLDGTPSDRPKFLASPWPRTIVGTHHYGQAIDTWGNPLTPELVGRHGFGVEIYALRQQDAGVGPIEATIESMRITLFYCE